LTAEKSIEQLIQSTVPEEDIKSFQYPEEVEVDPDPSRDLSEHQSYEFASLRQCLKETEDTHKLRLDYTKRIFWLICIWLICVAASIFMSGFPWFGFKLSDKVLITFITSTTISVLGIFVIVAKWMFPNNNKKDK
jgi:hypothetical protein